MKRLSFLCLAGLAFFALCAAGCPSKPKQVNTTPNPKPNPKPEEQYVPAEVRLKSIQTAVVNEKFKPESFADVKGFKPTKPGPYEAAEEAKTAYVMFKMQIEKPEGGADFSVSAYNTNTYFVETKFDRGTLPETKEFFIKDKKFPLSKGINNFKIKVKSPDGTVEGEYTVTVNYAGGVDETAKIIIPGVYCPAQRKPSEGEIEEDLVWMICIAGYCGYCPAPMEAAGKREKIAATYKEKGLRVVCISIHEPTHALALQKWKELSDYKYPIYDLDHNIFNKNFPGGGVPYDCCFRDGKKVADNTGAASPYLPYIKKAFKFN